MPKTSRAQRRKRVADAVVKKPQQSRATAAVELQHPQSAVSTSRTRSTNTVQGTQGMMMSALVALGCWGLAAYYTFIMNDSNHFLFGGFAAVLALLWSFSFGLRVRRWQQKR